MRRAAILSVGDEIVVGQQLDTNSRWLAEALLGLGLTPIEHRSVPDDRSAIAGALAEFVAAAELVIVTGGVGPTDDDLTRVALADLLAPPGGAGELVEDPEGVAWLRRWFAGRPRPMPEMNLRQAQRPAAARLLENRFGTAPGLIAEVTRAGRTATVVCLPGPPREMQPMFEALIAPLVRAAAESAVATATVAQIGLGESDAAQRLGALMDRARQPSIGTTASGGIVSARIRLAGPRADLHALRAQVEADACEVEARWSPFAYAREGGPAALAGALLRLLAQRGATLAVAESCTGGLLAATIVEVPGASAVFLGGWTTYSNEMKAGTLGVETALLGRHGAVSDPVVRAMAAGALERSGATCAISVSGIAGPEGGSDEKPVGTVWIGLAWRDGRRVVQRARCFRFGGDRRDIRERAVAMAMQFLRLEILAQAHEPLLWEVRRWEGNDDAAANDRASDPPAARERAG